MKITCVTYNILHGCHASKILENIQIFIHEKGADVICLQEAEIDIDSVLPFHWKVQYYRNGQACNLAIAWDSQKLQLNTTKTILFSMPKKQVFIWRFTKYYGMQLQRGAFSASFSAGGKIFRVTNAHLACEADMRHRSNQIRHLVKALNENFMDSEILLRDFNTAVLSMVRRFQEKEVEKALGAEYKNVFPNIKWTYNISDFDPKDGLGGISKFLGCFGIKLKCRLDYIFSKNLKLISGEEMTHLTGSDHRPLIATFET